MQEELQRQGVAPRAQKEEEEEDPLLQLLQELKDDLPVKLQLELAKREPPAPTVKEQGVECSKKLSQATGRLKGLVRKQLSLQETINETKEALRILLKDVGDVNAEIVECQKQVEEAKRELSAVVGETGPPAPDNDPMDIDTMLGKIGVTLTEEQQEALRDQIDQNKKRRLSPHPSRRPTDRRSPSSHPAWRGRGPRMEPLPILARIGQIAAGPLRTCQLLERKTSSRELARGSGPPPLPPPRAKCVAQ